MRNLNNTRTDLALEANELLKENAEQHEAVDEGIIMTEAGDDRIHISRIKITNNKGEQSLGRPIGDYVTLEIPELSGNQEKLNEDAAIAFKDELTSMLKLKDDAVILVVGLGNWNVTPDALGPKTVEAILITRHIKDFLPEEVRGGVRDVCAVAPGVLGITGIETAEIIKGTVDKVHPDVIIVIDALSSRKMDRVGTTIQIANTGISPGSGIGNRRMEFSIKTMGVPVLAIGVPTVCDAATIANDAIDLIMDGLVEQAGKGSDFYKIISDIDRDEKYELIRSLMEPYVGNTIVTPKQIDEMVDKIAKIIANGLNMAFHRNISAQDINRYLYS